LGYFLISDKNSSASMYNLPRFTNLGPNHLFKTLSFFRSF